MIIQRDSRISLPVQLSGLTVAVPEVYQVLSYSPISESFGNACQQIDPAGQILETFYSPFERRPLGDVPAGSFAVQLWGDPGSQLRTTAAGRH